MARNLSHASYVAAGRLAHTLSKENEEVREYLSLGCWRRRHEPSLNACVSGGSLFGLLWAV